MHLGKMRGDLENADTCSVQCASWMTRPPPRKKKKKKEKKKHQPGRVDQPPAPPPTFFPVPKNPSSKKRLGVAGRAFGMSFVLNVILRRNQFVLVVRKETSRYGHGSKPKSYPSEHPNPHKNNVDLIFRNFRVFAQSKSQNVFRTPPPVIAQSGLAQEIPKKGSAPSA